MKFLSKSALFFNMFERGVKGKKGMGNAVRLLWGEGDKAVGAGREFTGGGWSA